MPLMKTSVGFTTCSVIRITVFAATMSVVWGADAQTRRSSLDDATRAVGGHAAALVPITTPMAPPRWALLQRAVLEANAHGAQLFAATYLDARGFMRTPVRWGVYDGPDDVMENLRDWPLAYALGGAESLIANFERAWEGHLQQYTQTKIPSIPAAKDGIFYKEFITSQDWEHNGEGYAAFYFYGLSRPNSLEYSARMRRFAGFYMNEDAEAPNYDPTNKVIRSLFNGSRGPQLTPATIADYVGEPVPGRGPALSTRWANAGNIRGDHPLNLLTVTLATHAYMLTGDQKYRSWVLEYAGTWRDRTVENGWNIPSNIGLDGRIGGEWGGKWYGGVYGWNSPDTARRNYVLRGPMVGFGQALLLSGDDSYIDVLRGQIDNLYAARKTIGRVDIIPWHYGDNGWYLLEEGSPPQPRIRMPNFYDVLKALALWSTRPTDWERVPKEGWFAFLAGLDPDYPSTALAEALNRIRAKARAVQNDDSPPDVNRRTSPRGSRQNPVETQALVNLTMGGHEPNGPGDVLHVRLRHFDPDARRAGLPPQVAALVEAITPEGVRVTLVNLDPIREKRITVQTGAYAEHQCESVTVDGRTYTVGAPSFTVHLAPGAGNTLHVRMKMFTNQPTLAFPWDQPRG